MTAVTIRLTRDRTLTVPAEATTVPGLYVTPAGGHPAFPAEWRLTHGPSGHALPYWGRTPEHCHALARALATVRADWTDLPADLAQWPAGLLRDINRVGGEWEMRRHRLNQPRYFWPAATGVTP